MPTAYPPKAITAWSKRLRDWATGGEPDDLERIAPAPKGKGKPRDVFAYVIHEGKIRAPAGAMALIESSRPNSASARPRESGDPATA